MEKKELRTTTLSHPCRKCGGWISPQKMWAIFKRVSEKREWELDAWECLPCGKKGRKNERR
jgi:hypothetical protein